METKAFSTLNQSYDELIQFLIHDYLTAPCWGIDLEMPEQVCGYKPACCAVNAG